MNPLEVLVAHRSIRTYRPDPVPDADLDAILHAATRASSSGNMQTYVHHERYRDPDTERVLEIYRDRETEGWNRYMSFPDLRARILESGVKNLSQVYTQLKYTREDNEEISAELLANLARQRFLGGAG